MQEEDASLGVLSVLKFERCPSVAKEVEGKEIVFSKTHPRVRTGYSRLGLGRPPR